jgi:hypothetical protein
MLATPFEFVACWRELREKMAVGIEEWRLHHPKATLQEIEAMWIHAQPSCTRGWCKTWCWPARPRM